MSTEINILHDGSFDIATGRSRRETSWKNKEILWSELLERLKETHRTAENYSEYITSKKIRQDEIKDIGGFVGGFLSSGRRKANSIVHRQLITLDIDFGKSDIWDDFILLYGNTACIYSTHKHSPESPRYRLIIPLDRPVASDEYMAIGRRIAGNLGIDNFDHTTFQPSRLMYWPSTSKDGQYVFEYQDGAWLNADEVLNTYRDWHDSSEWPVSDREGTIINKAIQKQGDPLEKPGIVGAFCRTYDIHTAIETFLSDVYEATDLEDRYTYKEGSTAAGLVIYEDKYAYSHHGTDPASGKLCNAFDLVRLHKFGLKDEDASADTPSNRLPSYVSMIEFSTKDIRVRKQLGAERLQDARSDFEQEGEEEQEGANDDWFAELEVDGKGNYYSTINNIITILNNDPKLKGRFAFNQFEQREIALKDLPWRKITPAGKYLTDKDDAGLRHYLEKTYDITGVQKVKDALDLVLMENSFHPVRNYLNRLVWDGEERLDTLLIDYLGAEDSAFVRAVTRKIFVAAVTRIFKPGAKFDYVLTMIGKQGLKKSMLIDKLGKEWFSDSFSTVQGKEAFEQIQGVWLVEIAELSALRKAEVETIKHFITKREDRYRVAYGRRIENFPRQCVFFATTNKKNFLKDETGNRRFWPVQVHENAPAHDVAGLNEIEVDQLWAEAIEYYKQGEPLYLSKELEKQAFEKQAEHAEKDDRVGLIQKYLDTLLPETWDEMTLWDRRSFLQGDDLSVKGTVLRSQVCIAEIWCELFGGQIKDMTSFNTKDLHNIMLHVEGWERAKGNRRYKIYGTQKSYIRVENGLKSVNAEAATAFAEENLV